MNYYLIFITILILLASCEKNQNKGFTDLEHEVEVNQKLELVWEVKLAKDGIFRSISPHVWENDVVFAYEPFGTDFRIKLFDGEDGQQKWEWSNFLGAPNLHDPNYILLHENSFVYNNNNETGVIDLQTGISKWQYLLDGNAGAPAITKIGSRIFHKHNSIEWPQKYVHLVSTPIHIMKWDTILTIFQDSVGGYTPSIEGPSLWINEVGNQVLIFQVRSWDFHSNVGGRIDVYGYNESRNQIEFIIEDIEPTGNSNAIPPLIDGNRAYVIGSRNLHCIDLITKTIIWQKGFPGLGQHLMLSNLIFDEHRVIVKPDNDAIYAFNKYNGDLLWATYGAGHGPSHMVFYNGVIYYTASGEGKIFGIRTVNGEVIWAEDSPHDGDPEYPRASFRNSIGINTRLNYLYVHDRYFLMCYKLPEI